MAEQELNKEIGPEPEDELSPEIVNEPEETEVDDDKDDPISEAFFDLLSDVGMDFLWNMIGEMVDNEEIEDVPPDDADEAAQKAWLAKNMDTVRKAFKEELE